MKKLFKLTPILILIILLIIFKENIINIYNELSTSFYRTIIEEQRYILILRGLSQTLIISISSIILGSILGLILCIFRKNKLTKILIKVLQGIPVTVLLLIFYYVIFATINIDPTVVAIITFSIYFSAYIAEVFKASYDSINPTQIISSYSLGFNKLETLKYIILPQALTFAIPTFKNEAVSLIKLTSIAGYISIMDLTKASDIIRNRTYEAFFPLIVTAIIYFLICLIFSYILDYLYKKINPRNYKRGEKNVRN